MLKVQFFCSISSTFKLLHSITIHCVNYIIFLLYHNGCNSAHYLDFTLQQSKIHMHVIYVCRIIKFYVTIILICTYIRTIVGMSMVQTSQKLMAHACVHTYHACNKRNAQERQARVVGTRQCMCQWYTYQQEFIITRITKN